MHSLHCPIVHRCQLILLLMLLALTRICRVVPALLSSRLVLGRHSGGSIMLLSVWSRFRCWTLLLKPAPGAASIDSFSTTLGAGFVPLRSFLRMASSSVAQQPFHVGHARLVLELPDSVRLLPHPPPPRPLLSPFGVLRRHCGGSRRGSGGGVAVAAAVLAADGAAAPATAGEGFVAGVGGAPAPGEAPPAACWLG